MKVVKKVLGCLRKADQDFNLIENGDRICVGISGGKDSSTLLYCLHLYKKFSKKDYTLVPIYCHMGFADNPIDDLITFFQQFDLQIIRCETQIAEILDFQKDENGKISCSLCSRLRKGAIIRAAKEYGCNKLAFGHHSDDAVETLFLNMIHGGRIATFKPDTFLERQDIHLIRPLIYSYESDIKKLSELLEFPIITSGCTNDGYSKREEMKQLLHQLYHQYHCKDNFQLMLRNTEKVELLQPIKKKTDY